jgi:NAD(P)-dependent dehydrogenase (short-subunit alcohol dehydrogenase family)
MLFTAAAASTALSTSDDAASGSRANTSPVAGSKLSVNSMAIAWSSLIAPNIFLCSPASDFVSGQLLYVDGGMLSVL